jgi:hypothetical protein
MRPTHKKDIPVDAIISYLRTVASFRPEKENPQRVRITVGGNKIIYDGPTTTRTAELGTVKILINSVISTRNGHFMTITVSAMHQEMPLQSWHLGTHKVHTIKAVVRVLVLCHLLDSVNPMIRVDLLHERVDFLMLCLPSLCSSRTSCTFINLVLKCSKSNDISNLQNKFLICALTTVRRLSLSPRLSQ